MNPTGPSKTTLWRRANPEGAQAHREREQRRWRTDPTIKKRHYAHAAAERRRLRHEVFAAYGGAFCACCREDEELFLTIDHMKNDGAQERRELGWRGTGTAFYRRLKRLNYPPGYQVLCYNCNCGKRMNKGVCPHKEDWV